jgi:hypothetical protein
MNLPPTEAFSLDTVTNLIRGVYDDGKLKEDLEPSMGYVKKYIFPLSNGNHGFYDAINKKMIVYDNQTIRNVYFNRMPKSISNWYFTKYTTLYTISCKVGDSYIKGNVLNTCGRFKHDYQKYSTFPKSVQKSVDVMLDFYKAIWCNGKQDHYEHLIKWIAYVCKGLKNTSFLYLKGGEGIGKSRGTEFIHHHVIGSELCEEAKSEPLKSRFNKILFGKLFVTFEELEKSSENEWETINANLKRLATSKMATYEEKNEKAFSTDNIINIVVNTNRDAIKDADGRRVFILPVSCSKKGDETYWKMLNKTCFNDTVGKAFYSLMLEQNTDDYDPQAFPQSDLKDDINIDRLHNVYKYIKFRYIYKNKDFKITVKEAHEEYEEYCTMSKIESKYIVKKSMMITKLREVGIEYKSSNGKTVYRTTNDELRNIAKIRNWLTIHDNDELDDNVDVVDVSDAIDYHEPVDKYQKIMIQLHENVKAKDKKIAELEKIIEELKNGKTQPIVKKITTKNDQPPPMKKMIPKKEQPVGNVIEDEKVKNLVNKLFLG